MAGYLSAGDSLMLIARGTRRQQFDVLFAVAIDLERAVARFLTVA